MADAFGRRRVFIAGLAIFTLGSLACALSPGFWALVGFRCLQAAGASALVPSSLGLVLTIMPADRVARGVRIWVVTGSVAGATGPRRGRPADPGGLAVDLRSEPPDRSHRRHRDCPGRPRGEGGPADGHSRSSRDLDDHRQPGCAVPGDRRRLRLGMGQRQDHHRLARHHGGDHAVPRAEQATSP